MKCSSPMVACLTRPENKGTSLACQPPATVGPSATPLQYSVRRCEVNSTGAISGSSMLNRPCMVPVPYFPWDIGLFHYTGAEAQVPHTQSQELSATKPRLSTVRPPASPSALHS